MPLSRKLSPNHSCFWHLRRWWRNSFFQLSPTSSFFFSDVIDLALVINSYEYHTLIFHEGIREVIKKNWEKAARLTASICENFRTFSHWIWFLDTQNRFYTSLRRGWKMYLWCIFIAFLTAPRQLKPWISRSVSRSLQRNFRWSKNIFLVKLVLGHI